MEDPVDLSVMALMLVEITVEENVPGGASHAYRFDHGPIVIGRDRNANLVIDRDVVSGVHGVLELDDAGVVTYIDLGSRNGTTLNGRALVADETVTISGGDALAIGALRLRITLNPPPRAPDPTVRDPFAAGKPDSSLPVETEILPPVDAPASTPPSTVVHQLPPRMLVATPLARPRYEMPGGAIFIDSSPQLPALPAHTPASQTSLEPAVPATAQTTATAPPGENESNPAPMPAAARPTSPPHGELFQPGNRIGGGKYEIRRLMGSGGMSAVYCAFDFRFNGEVAIKVLAPGLAARPEMVQRFQREAETARAVNSPNVVTIHDVGMEAGLPFLVMELLEGEPLRDLIARGPLSVYRASGILLDTLNGVIAAHDRGITHRDLKPDNIFLVGAGRNRTAKVLDFGISKTDSSRLTQHGAIMGTPSYRSPEQIMDSSTADARSDQFALGAIFYEMLTGFTPHVAKNAMAVAQNILHGRYPKIREVRPEIEENIERIIDRLLSVNPDDRYSSTRELGDVIRPYAPKDAQGMYLRLSSNLALGKLSGVFEVQRTIIPRAGETEILPEGGGVRRLPPTELLPPQRSGSTPTRGRRAAAGWKAVRNSLGVILLAMLGGGAGVWIMTPRAPPQDLSAEAGGDARSAGVATVPSMARSAEVAAAPPMPAQSASRADQQARPATSTAVPAVAPTTPTVAPAATPATAPQASNLRTPPVKRRSSRGHKRIETAASATPEPSRVSGLSTPPPLRAGN